MEFVNQEDLFPGFKNIGPFMTSFSCLLMAVVYKRFLLPNTDYCQLTDYPRVYAQFPIEKFLSYGRIFTLHYYFLLMCILFFLLKSSINF